MSKCRFKIFFSNLESLLKHGMSLEDKGGDLKSALLHYNLNFVSGTADGIFRIWANKGKN